MTLWQAPRVAPPLSLADAPDLRFSRHLVSRDIALCHAAGRVLQPLEMRAPPSDGPRLHLQLLRAGHCRLVNDQCDAQLIPNRLHHFVTRSGDVAWRSRTETPLDVLSVDIGLDWLASELQLGVAALATKLEQREAGSLLTTEQLPMIDAPPSQASNRLAARLDVDAAVLSLLAHWMIWAGLDGPESAGRRDAAAFARLRVNAALPPRSVGALAVEAGHSPRFLARIYRERYGASLFQDLLAARMRYAARALRQNDMAIKTIAWTAGYATAAAFSDAFQRHYQMSPSDYRTASTSER